MNNINFTIYTNLIDKGIHDSICQEICNVDGDTIQEKLNTLSNCNCCARHQINKPRTLDIWINTPLNYNYRNTHCTCKCRHLARFICRNSDHNLVKYKDEKICEDSF